MAPPTDRIDTWASGGSSERIFLNATAVCFEGRGVLMLGAAGSGKSTLALELIALGASLIADDGVFVDLTSVRLHRPPQSPDGIEARGLGILHSGPTTTNVPASLVVDLDRRDTDRLPAYRQMGVGSQFIPLILGAAQNGLATKVTHMLRFGRIHPHP